MQLAWWDWICSCWTVGEPERHHYHRDLRGRCCMPEETMGVRGAIYTGQLSANSEWRYALYVREISIPKLSCILNLNSLWLLARQLITPKVTVAAEWDERIYWVKSRRSARHWCWHHLMLRWIFWLQPFRISFGFNVTSSSQILFRRRSGVLRRSPWIILPE